MAFAKKKSSLMAASGHAGVRFRSERGKEVQDKADIVADQQLGRLRRQGAVREMGRGRRPQPHLGR